LEDDKYKTIKEYFKNRPNDLLIMEINEGWKPLCEFLDVAIPPVNFPCLNVSKIKNPPPPPKSNTILIF